MFVSITSLVSHVFPVLFGNVTFAPAVRQESHEHSTLPQACGHLLQTGVWPSQSSVDGVERLASGHARTEQFDVMSRPRQSLSHQMNSLTTIKSLECL